MFFGNFEKIVSYFGLHCMNITISVLKCDIHTGRDRGICRDRLKEGGREGGMIG